MRSFLAFIIISALFAAPGICGVAGGAHPNPHHDLSIRLDPDKGMLAAEDTVTLPADAGKKLVFTLHAGLNPVMLTTGVLLQKGEDIAGPLPRERFTVALPAGARAFTVRYSGVILHPLEQEGAEQARGYQSTAGIISSEGVFLSASSGWYPDLGTGLLSFTLETTMPREWDTVSQGERTRQGSEGGATVTRWESPEPQEEIYLVAGKFTEFLKPAGDVAAMAFLREPDSGLAAKYLDATARYLALYEKLLGPYPYRKFALVENFWETGFGMPSFTLLGPAIIRLPFIVNTSYPHEILHNWWGNSVYPDSEKGNWSEGLTAYLADHLLKEQQGQGAEYRVNTLQKYADYVLEGRDFPLTSFTARHSSATEAVGYGKALMFFHMLRLRLGDELFIAGLRDFYRNHRFRSASWDDLRASFKEASGRDLAAEFRQWTTRIGAPEIRLNGVEVQEKGDTGTRRRGDAEKRGDGYILTAKLEQTQRGDAYQLRVPVAVTLEGRERAYQAVLEMKEKKLEVRLVLPARPLRIDVDPEFDLFRRLGRDEIPPAVSQALGGQKMLVVLPSGASEALLAAYRRFAESLGATGPDTMQIKPDTEVRDLPADRTLVVLGWENRLFAKAFRTLSGYPASLTKAGIRLCSAEVPVQNHSVVLTSRNSANPDAAIMIVAADRAEALPGLGRKLPHYHKYSYLAFEGDEPANVAKGRWPVLRSPLTTLLSGRSNRAPVEMGRLAERSALAELPPAFSKERMLETVKLLASDELKGRETGTPELDRAADIIAKQFAQAGLAPGGDPEGTYFQEWEDPVTHVKMKNVIGVVPGNKSELGGTSIVIGAHYDHLGLGMSVGRTEDRGKVHPGADDNASGVAVLVELAKTLRDTLKPDRSIVFAAFTGEEEGRLGSVHYVQNEKRYPAAKTIAMLNLDTIGRLGKKKLLVIGAGSAEEWPHIFRGAGFVTGVEIETVTEELDASDQNSFLEAGVPAVQLFSGPHLDYHRPTDTIEKIDADGLLRVASIAKEVVEYLANREGPLTTTLKGGAPAGTGPKKERKVSLGTIPDFAFKSEGVRLSGVAPGSPAEKAGMKEGDVIVRMNDASIKRLKDLSDALKSMKAGDKASVVFLREGKEMKIETEVKER